jgi:hypothetical protein
MDANAVIQWLQNRGKNQIWNMAILQRAQELTNQVNILSSMDPRLLKQEGRISTKGLELLQDQKGCGNLSAPFINHKYPISIS